MDGDILVLRDSFELALRAARKSEKTIERYLYGVAKFASFLDESSGPSYARHIEPGHVRAFLEAELRVNKPSTALTRYGDLRAFFRFLVAEEEISESPVAKVEPPQVPEYVPELVPDDAARRLLAGVQGNDFRSRRDAAILWVFVDTPIRLGALAALEEPDVDLRAGLVRVIEKGSKELRVPFGPRTARALDRYRRVRALHPLSELRGFWLGQRGVLTPSGIRQMLETRATEAGIGHVHPHMWRGTFAHNFLRAGGSEGDLMELAGWESEAMPRKYAKGLAKERAVESYRRLRLSDRL